MAAEKIDALELNIESKLSVENLDKLIESLRKLGKEVDKVKQTKPKAAIKEVGDGANEAANGLDKFLGKTVRIAAVIALFRKAADTISDCVSESLTYNKTLNMFTVSLGEYATNATKYGETVRDALGIDIAGWQKAQGIFQTLITGFGVTGDQAAYMSQNLTQLSYDIASFYNITNEEAQNKLKSAIAGRLEPIRKLGWDLSQSKLVDIAKNPKYYGQQTFAINEQTGAIEANTVAVDDNTQHKIVNFNQLTQQEKVQLRYIALMTQVTQVQGAYAKALNDPANQMKVFKEQLSMTSRELGNVFIPALNQVLPYLTAFTQLVGEAFRSLASLFGFELPDMSDRMDISSVAEPYNDVVQATGRAANNAKKLRDYTIGLDELNVLKKPDDTAGGGSGVSGQNSNLSNLLTPGYDFLTSAITNRVKEAKEMLAKLGADFKAHPFEFPMKLLWNGAEILGENFWEAFLGMTPEELAIQAEANGRTVGEEFAIAWITAVEDGCEDIIEIMFGSPEGLAQRAADAGRTVAEQFLYEFSTRMVKTKTDDIWGVNLPERAKNAFGTTDFGNTSANEAYKRSAAYQAELKAAEERRKRMQSGNLAIGYGSTTTSNAGLKMAIVSPVTSLGNTAADEARKAGERVAKAYADGMNSGVGQVSTAGSNLYTSGKNGADNNGKGTQMFYNTAANEAYKFAMGLTSPKAKSEANLGGKALAAQGTNGAKSLANDSTSGFKYAGQQSGAGYVAGVNNKTNLTNAKSAGATIASNALKKLKEVLGIHSPSKAFGEAGMYSVEGYAQYMEKYTYLAENAARDMARSSLAAVETANAYTTSNAGYGIGASNQGAMADFMSNMYNAFASAMTGINTKGDTIVMIDGKEVFRVVQKQARDSGVAIGNGAFV